MNRMYNELLNQAKYQLPFLLMNTGVNIIYVYGFLFLLIFLYNQYESRINRYVKGEKGKIELAFPKYASEFIIQFYPNQVKGMKVIQCDFVDKPLGDLNGAKSMQMSAYIGLTNQTIKCLLKEIENKLPFLPDNTELMELPFDFVYEVKEVEVFENDKHTRRIENKYYLVSDRPELLLELTTYIHNLVCYKEEKQKKIKYTGYSFSSDGTALADMVKVNIYKDFKNIFLSRENERLLVDYSREFISSKDSYSEKGIPYKKSYLLHGSPGEGKTSTIFALANEYKMSIFSFNLNEFSNSSLLQECRTTINSIVVFEELDTFEGSRKRSDDLNTNFELDSNRRIGESVKNEDKNKKDEDKKKKDPVRLETLLSILDGYLYLHGCIVIITTNHLNKLDPAIYRPGRVDHIVHFNKCNRYQLEKIYQLYFKKKLPKDYRFIDNVISTAEIINSIFIPNGKDSKQALSILSERIKSLQ